MSDSLLIIFAKNPELGKVKTRLAASVGNEVALAIYFQLLNKTKEVTETLLLDKSQLRLSHRHSKTPFHSRPSMYCNKFKHV